jgi:hypothetical protein
MNPMVIGFFVAEPGLYIDAESTSVFEYATYFTNPGSSPGSVVCNIVSVCAIGHVKVVGWAGDHNIYRLCRL